MRVIKRLFSSSTAPASTFYDIVVVGAGIVGQTFVSRLLSKLQSNRSVVDNQGSGIRIAVLDIKPPPDLAICLGQQYPDIRVLAPIQARTQPYLAMNVWDSETTSSIQFSAFDLSTDMLGRIAEDNSISASLFRSLQEHPLSSSLSFTFGSSIESADFDTSLCTIALKDKDGNRSRISTRLVVGADGANSVVRRLAGIPSWGWGYGQEAIVATVKVNRQHETAWQKYLPSGPLALLPLWSQYSSIVWSVPFLEAKRLKSLPDDKFIDELNSAFQTPPNCPRETSFRLPPFLQRMVPEPPVTPLPPAITALQSHRVSFPLQFQQASSYTSSRVALVGDAAHSIHPQAGQGLNLGIADADDLARVVGKGLSTGQDIGDPNLLVKYGSKRYAANLLMMSGVDAIHHTFTSTAGPVRALRAAGLLGLQKSSVAKNQIARIAMGLSESR